MTRILICQLPPGSIISPEKTGFGSLPKNQKHYPAIVMDQELIKMVEDYNRQLDQFRLGTKEQQEIAESMIMLRQSFFAKEIRKKYKGADCSDVDFLRVVKIPDELSFTVCQGRSGYEEIVVWSWRVNPRIIIFKDE